MVTAEKHLVKAARVANILLAGSGIICVLVLFHYVYHYSWTGQRYFTSYMGIIVYYIFPAVLAGLLFASVKLRAEEKVRLALFLCSTAFSLYSIEVWFSLPHVKTVREKVELANKFKVDFDSRTKLEVIADLRAKGIEAYPAIATSYLMQTPMGQRLRSETTVGELWPFGSISNKVSVLCNEGGDYTIYKSDEYGFHNPRGLWNTGQIDIVALGDSFTEGWCVPSDKNFVALIRQRYPRTLNLGISGNGPLTELAMIEEYLSSLRPRIVLWFYHETDRKDLKSEKKFPLLMRYLNDSFAQGLLARQVEIDRRLAVYVDEEMKKNKFFRIAEEIFEEVRNQGLTRKIGEIIKLGQVRQILGLSYGQSSRKYHYVEELWEVEDLFRRILLKAKASVAAWGGKIYFVYLPGFQTDWGAIEPDRERVLMLARTLGFPIIDIQRVFEGHSDPSGLFPFRMPNHYNLEGHRLVAEEVVRFLDPEVCDKLLVDCSDHQDIFQRSN